MNSTIEPIFVSAMLEHVSKWDEVSTCLKSLKNVISLTEDVFYYQFCHIKDIMKSEIASLSLTKIHGNLIAA